MKKISIQALLFIAAILVFLPSSAVEISAEKIGSKINVTVNGRFFTSYIFSDDEKYPFFYPVNGPASGASVTSMRNGVYPHHSSLFFGCDMVNGGNYWQEGLERGRIISENTEILKEGSDMVVISNECIWSRPGAPSPIKDTRRIVITSPTEKLIQLDITITMKMLMDVHIPRTSHSLFSARMAADLSVAYGGTMINAQGDMGEKETFGEKSPWIDYYGSRGDVTEGLAIMQHPSNPWYPSTWFTRDYGFMSPTPMNWPADGKETFFAKGQEITLRYRVLVHDGDHEEVKIAELFDQYCKEE